MRLTLQWNPRSRIFRVHLGRFHGKPQAPTLTQLGPTTLKWFCTWHKSMQRVHCPNGSSASSLDIFISCGYHETYLLNYFFSIFKFLLFGFCKVLVGKSFSWIGIYTIFVIIETTRTPSMSDFSWKVRVRILFRISTIRTSGTMFRLKTGFISHPVLLTYQLQSQRGSLHFACLAVNQCQKFPHDSCEWLESNGHANICTQISILNVYWLYHGFHHPAFFEDA